MITIHKHKIELITHSDIVEFVKIATEATGTVKLIDDNGFCVNGKSLLGAMANGSRRNLCSYATNHNYVVPCEQLKQFKT